MALPAPQAQTLLDRIRLRTFQQGMGRLDAEIMDSAEENRLLDDPNSLLRFYVKTLVEHLSSRTREAAQGYLAQLGKQLGMSKRLTATVQMPEGAIPTHGSSVILEGMLITDREAEAFSGALDVLLMAVEMDRFPPINPGGRDDQRGPSNPRPRPRGPSQS